MTDIERIKELVEKLNFYRNSYYNNAVSLITDKEYDDLFDELKSLEEKTSFIINNSPTQEVGYEVKSNLEKVIHNHPMLSLDKTKDLSEITKFLNGKDAVAMLKMDGLTCSLRYVNGELVGAETRGNGTVGEDILHNAKIINNIPKEIPFKNELIIDGEVIISTIDFEKINSTLPEEEKKYATCRNLASGSVRQLDSKIASKRMLKFIAWKVVKGFSSNSFSERLSNLWNLGFDVVPYRTIIYGAVTETLIEILKKQAEKNNYPIDGLVFSYDDIEYGESLGETTHHVRSQMAYKFYDEEVETELLDIDWTMGKTGVLTPTAIFKTVKIDNTDVSRASLHNLSIMNELYSNEWYKGLKLTVFKANMIIPQVSKVEDGKKISALPIITKCPICDSELIEIGDNSISLMCPNNNCSGKLLGKLCHAVSKDALSIDGLSEQTLKKFIALGWLNSIKDIYYLGKYRAEMSNLDGFGEKSIERLFTSIEKSRHLTLDKFIYALSIPLIGKSASKTISRFFNGSFDDFILAVQKGYDFTWSTLKDFGDTMAMSIIENCDTLDIISLASEFEFENLTEISDNSNIKGKTFVITGSLTEFKNRKEAQQIIENLGGKVASSVSKNTDYLVNNDVDSTSSKNKKAKELNIPIVTDKELKNMIG